MWWVCLHVWTDSKENMARRVWEKIEMSYVRLEGMVVSWL